MIIAQKKKRTSAEQHEKALFDFDEEIYGEEIRVKLVDYIRDDAKLDSLEALKKQIEEDCKAARAVLSQRQSKQRDF